MSKQDDFATYLTALATVTALFAPYDNFNEGQKTLMTEYSYGNFDVNIEVDWNQLGGIYSSELISSYIDVGVTHEEAFGSLFDDAQQIGRRYAEIAFDFVEFSKEAVFDNFKSASDFVSRRISVYS